MEGLKEILDSAQKSMEANAEIIKGVTRLINTEKIQEIKDPEILQKQKKAMQGLEDAFKRFDEVKNKFNDLQRK